MAEILLKVTKYANHPYHIPYLPVASDIGLTNV